MVGVIPLIAHKSIQFILALVKSCVRVLGKNRMKSFPPAVGGPEWKSALAEGIHSVLF